MTDKIQREYHDLIVYEEHVRGMTTQQIEGQIDAVLGGALPIQTPLPEDTCTAILTYEVSLRKLYNEAGTVNFVQGGTGIYAVYANGYIFVDPPLGYKRGDAVPRSWSVM